MVALLDRARSFLSARRLQNSPLTLELARHTEEYFKNSKLNHFSQAGKDELVADFYNTVSEISDAPDPVLKFREAVASAVVPFADLQVLCLKPQEKAAAFYASAKHISAELYVHIAACAPHNEELQGVISDCPAFTDSELIDCANTLCCAHLYRANGFTLVGNEVARIAKTPVHNWLRPFILSMMIFSENCYRRKINLPRSDPDADVIRALRHSMFMQFVLRGHSDPLRDWETHFGVCHAEDI